MISAAARLAIPGLAEVGIVCSRDAYLAFNFHDPVRPKSYFSRCAVIDLGHMIGHRL